MCASGSGDHYFSDQVETASKPLDVELVLPQGRWTLRTDRGVFAKGRIDYGTKLLLVDGPEPDAAQENLLDLGCGYGPIAIALAARNPDATVWAIDVNPRARELCAHNATALGLDNINVAEPSGVPESVRFDAIWSNPPIRVGKAPLRDLLARWLQRLEPEGRAHLVVQKHLGADSLQRWLQDQGWSTTRRGSSGGYRLLDVRARAADQ